MRYGNSDESPLGSETGDRLDAASRVPSTEARDGTGRREDSGQQWSCKSDDGHPSWEGRKARLDHWDTERRLMKTLYNFIDAWCNGSALVLHTKRQGSIP